MPRGLASEYKPRKVTKFSKNIEDILDPYGGAFKVTKGLSSKFPDRVKSTPISEAAIIGIAGGMSIGGLKPIIEIIRLNIPQ